MKKYNFLFCLLFLSLALSSCSDKNKKEKVVRTDTQTSGLAKIVVDGTLAPVVQELVDVFESTNPDAIILPTYTNYRNAYDLFMKDSIRLVIGPRQLTFDEEQIIKERKQKPRSLKLAIDGIALVVNKSNTDTLITTAEIKKIMTGEITSWKEINSKSSLGDIDVVFDSPNSSTVKYINDSLCHGLPLGKNIRSIAEDNITELIPTNDSPNQQVLDYVASTPNAIGVIGVNWISNPTDERKWTFINKINVMRVSREEKATSKNSYQPLPYQMALNLDPDTNEGYPLTREIYMILSDVRGGLPSGFYDFAAKDKGQRLIYRAGLLPSRATIRLVSVKSE